MSDDTGLWGDDVGFISQYVVRVNITILLRSTHARAMTSTNCTILVHSAASADRLTLQLQATFVQICDPENEGGNWQDFSFDHISVKGLSERQSKCILSTYKTLKKEQPKMWGTNWQCSLFSEPGEYNVNGGWQESSSSYFSSPEISNSSSWTRFLNTSGTPSTGLWGEFKV